MHAELANIHRQSLDACGALAALDMHVWTETSRRSSDRLSLRHRHPTAWIITLLLLPLPAMQ